MQETFPLKKALLYNPIVMESVKAILAHCGEDKATKTVGGEEK